MSEFYNIDSTRVSHREYWWGTKSPLVLLGWLLKWLRVRIPSSTDDPNVDCTTPFVTEALPPEVETIFQPLTSEFTALGFLDPVFHVISDPGTRGTIYWATFRHVSGRDFCRIHHRVWLQSQKPNRALFPMFFTAFADGTFLVSSSGKPDMTAPETTQMNRMYRAPAAELLAAHERLESSLGERKTISPVSNRDELLAASERHHLLVRDFHLARGVFRPRSEADRVKADAFAASVGNEQAEVIAELARIQDQKPSWRTTVWVMVGSLVLFLALGAAKWDWKFTLWIIPVLLFHEGGHWVAMRLFHYRNLRMFFIPLFGAAVTGQHWNVPGWKKALVSLAGPVPGIAVGVILGMASLVLKHAWLTQAALVLLLVNGLNLLPILPLDGGHVLQDTLFCRNRWLDGAFRLLAIVGLGLLGTFGGMIMFRYVALAMLFALPIVFKLSKVADDVRRQPLPPPLPGEDRIPAPTAQAIVTAVRAAFPMKASLGNRMVAQHKKMQAQHTLAVFESLNARPPGALATMALLALHGCAFLAAILVAALLVVGQQGALGDFFSAAARQPRHSFEPGDTQTWPAVATAGDATIRTRVVSTLKNRGAARSAFTQITNRIPPASTLTRLGDSLVLSLPASDDPARDTWFDDFQARATNTFVALSNAPVMASLTFLAPTKTAVTNLTRDMKDYFATAYEMHLIAPWSPEAKRVQFATWRQARQEWSTISREISTTWQDPSLKPYDARTQAAYKRGARAEAVRLGKERSQHLEDLRAQARQRLLNESPRRVTPALLDLHARLNKISLTNRVERSLLLREIAAKLGEVPFAGEKPAAGATACGAIRGSVMTHGLLIEVRWINFSDVAHGFPALTQWLRDQGCRQFQYDLDGAGWIGSLDGQGDVGDDEE